MSYTRPQSLTGLPACVVRAGFDDRGLPVGVQLTGPAWSEPRLLATAEAFFATSVAIQQRRPAL